MLRHRAALGITCSALLLLPGVGCRKKKSTARCEKHVARTHKWLGALCQAWTQALHQDAHQLNNVSLVQVDRPALNRLPMAPLVMLRNRRLLVDGQPVPYWTRFFSPPTVTAPGSDPTTGIPKPEKGAQKVRDKGMLGVLGAMTGKLGSMFSRDKTVSKEAEDALGALMGHTRGGGAVGPVVDALMNARRKSNPSDVILAIDPSTPAKQVTALFDRIAKARFRHVTLLFSPQKTPTLPQPLDSARYQALGKLLPRERHRSDLTLRSGIVKNESNRWKDAGCPAVATLLLSLAAVPADKRCRSARTRLPRALRKCGCPLDEGPLLAVLQRALEPLVFVTTHRVILSRTAEELKMKDPKEPWQKLAPRVLKSDPRAFRFQRFSQGRYRSRKPRVWMRPAWVRGGIDAAIVRRVVRRHLSEIQHCYIARGIADNRQLAGRVAVAFTIKMNGQTEKISIKQTTLSHPDTQRCILSTVRRWRFPRPEGSPAQVVYPFVFKPWG